MSIHRTFAVRCRQPEWMDQPSLSAVEHRAALAGLRRVNRISRAGWPIWRAIRRWAASAARTRVRVLDLAAGGGDVAVWLSEMGRRHQLEMQVTGCDLSDVAVEFARRHAAAAGLGSVEFRRLDVVHDELPTGYDVVMCSLFLHHLAETQAVDVLRRMAAATCGIMLVDDLRRCPLGYAAAWLGCRLLTRSPIVHVDGPLSVAGAFTVDEMQQMCRRAELTDARIATHWPWRFLLSWRRPHA